MGWEAELIKSTNANGLHSFSFFKQGEKIITYRKYLQLRKEGWTPQIVKHMGIKINVNEDVSSFVLFTTKNQTLFPNLGKVDNVALQGNVFNYANKVLFIENKLFAQYYTISNIQGEFPSYVRYMKKDEILKHALRGYYESYRVSTMNGPILIGDVDNTLFYQKKVNDVFMCSTLGILPLYHSKTFFAYKKQTNFHDWEIWKIESEQGISELKQANWLNEII